MQLLRPRLHFVEGDREPFHPAASKHVDKLMRLLPEIVEAEVRWLYIHFIEDMPTAIGAFRTPKEQVQLSESLQRRLIACCERIFPVCPWRPIDGTPTYDPSEFAWERQAQLTFHGRRGRKVHVFIKRIAVAPRARNLYNAIKRLRPETNASNEEANMSTYSIGGSCA